MPRSDDPRAATSGASVTRLNLVVLGRPDVGKSALIEAVFGLGETEPDDELLSAVPRTRHAGGAVRVARVGVADLPAAESFLVDFRAAGTLGESVRPHAAWYTVHWRDDAFTAGQGALVQRLAQEVPVLLVVTNVPANLAGQRGQSAVQFARYLQSQLLPVAADNTVFLTNARADPRTGSPVHGLAELLAATYAAAPEASKRAVTTAQQVQRDRRDVRSRASSLRRRARDLQRGAQPYLDAIKRYRHPDAQ